MCRLLSYVAAREAAPADVLADVLPAFTELSADHKDGWGLAWPGVDGVQAVREPLAARVSERYTAALRDTVADAALLHLRLATPGLAVADANTHPFVRDGIAFIHNGFVGPIPEIEPMIHPDLPPEGDTDSERYFLALLTELRRGATPQRALADTAQQVLALDTSSSANAMLLTENALHVTCAYLPGKEPPGRDADYFVLRYRITPDAVIVASSGLPEAGWKVLPNGAVLSVARKSLECTIA